MKSNQQLNISLIASTLFSKNFQIFTQLQQFQSTYVKWFNKSTGQVTRERTSTLEGPWMKRLRRPTVFSICTSLTRIFIEQLKTTNYFKSIYSLQTLNNISNFILLLNIAAMLFIEIKHCILILTTKILYST